MASNCVIFKVFLRSDGSPEARKFILDDASVITSYIFIKEKLLTIFPKLRNAAFRIIWKDTDGDEITIDSDDDLIMAFTEMTGPVKTLYINVSNRHQPQDYCLRSSVICDACNKQISGYRYKCLQCPDFDLCLECEHAGHHSEHYMLRTSNGELPLQNSCRKIADTINKSLKRAQSMACRDTNRHGKGGRRFDRKHDHHFHKHCNADGETSKNEIPQPGPSTCPMSDAFYDFASAAAQAVGAVPPTPQDPNTNEGTDEGNKAENEPKKQQPQPPHFVDIMVKALNNIFGDQPQPTHGYGFNIPPAQPQPPAGVSAQTSIPGNEPPIFSPMEQDSDVRPSPPRRGSWTMLDNDIAIENRPGDPAESTPSAPQLDPKIAAGLRQLEEMGFANQGQLIELLKRFEGNVGYVVKFIFENGH